MFLLLRYFQKFKIQIFIKNKYKKNSSSELNFLPINEKKTCVRTIQSIIWMKYRKISPKNNIIIKGGLIFEKNNNYYFI